MITRRAVIAASPMLALAGAIPAASGWRYVDTFWSQLEGQRYGTATFCKEFSGRTGYAYVSLFPMHLDDRAECARHVDDSLARIGAELERQRAQQLGGP